MINNRKLQDKIRKNNRRLMRKSFDLCVNRLIAFDSYQILPVEESDKRLYYYKSLSVKKIYSYRDSMDNFDRLKCFFDINKFIPKYLNLLAPDNYSYFFGIVEINGFRGIKQQYLKKEEPLFHFYDELGDNQLVLDIYEESSSYYYDIELFGDRWIITL